MFALSYLILIAVSLANPIVISQSPFYKVTTATHDRSTVTSFLQQAYRSILGDGNPLKASPELSLLTRERLCYEHTTILFYVKALNLVTKDDTALECRTNLNSKFSSVVRPIPNVHEQLFFLSDALEKQLEEALIERFLYYPHLKNYQFSNFTGLDYDMECLAGYQELMQVRLKTQAIEAEVEQVIQVPPVCEFAMVKQNYEGESRLNLKLVLPMNSELYCRKGRTKSCNRISAEYKNSRYKVVPFTDLVH